MNRKTQLAGEKQCARFKIWALKVYALPTLILSG